MSAARGLAVSLSAAGAGLVLLDLLRAERGEALRPWQYALALLTLALVAGFLRARGVPWPQARPYLGLGLLLLPALVDHAREIRSDGVHYYAFLRSALFDRDLDFANDYPLLGSDYGGPNPLPVGAPLLWSPLASLVHLAREGGRLFGLPVPLGAEPVYAAAVCLASFAYGAAGLFLLLFLLRRTRLAAAAFWATVVAWVGSPLRFYLSVLPSFAHACEFFAAVLVLWTFLDLRARRDPGSAFRAGLAGGLVFLVRSQDGLLFMAPGLLLASRAVRPGGRREALSGLVRLAAGFALAALPQLAVWQAQFGVPFLVPHRLLHGEDFFHAAEPALAGTLISPKGGLFTSYPALLVALVGLVVLAAWPRPRLEAGRREAFDAGYLAFILPVLLLAWWLNASVFDWYQVRRYTGLVPLLAPGLIAVLAPLARAGTLFPALVALLAWRYDDALDARRSNPGDPVPVRLALSTLADRAVAEVYGLVEPVAPRAAVALLASYTGEPVLDEEVTYLDLSREVALLELPRKAVFLAEAAIEDGRPARWVNERYTRLAVPLAWRGPLLVRVEARALETREPQRVALEWNGVACGERPMEPAWREYTFEVPPAAVRLGTNSLVLRFARALTLNRAGPAVP